MKSKTSYTIKEKTLAKLQVKAEETGLTPNLLVKKALKILVGKTKTAVIINSITISYQEKTNDYKIQSIYFSDDEYQFVIKLRDYYRMSVSKLIALALNLYLNNLVKVFKKKSRLPLKCFSKFYSNFDVFIENFEVRWWNRIKFPDIVRFARL